MTTCVTASFENVSKITDFIKKKININPTVGIICGSGLGKLADTIENPTVLSYADIPNFPKSTVVGHAGNLVFGYIGKKPVICMQGRFHGYEGFTRDHIAIPIRVMKLLGVETLLVSNAAGGLDQNLNLGDLVILKDHISFPGLAQNNVLIGPNEDKFGDRFIPTSDAYSSDLRQLALKLATEQGIGKHVREGVYVHVSGPTYESPAECKMLRMLGADVVGMSTVPEVCVAHHAGIKVFAISLVTNISVLDTESKNVANHEEVLSVAETRTAMLQELFKEIIIHV